MSSDPRGLLLRPPTGEPFWFDAGALCLEFLMTGGEGELSVFELLHAPEDLAEWLPRSRLAAAADPAPGDFRIGADEFATAKRLRAALWRIAPALATGHDPRPSDIALLGRIAAEPPPVPTADAALRRGWAVPITGAQVCSAIARDAIELFTGPHRERIRRCGGVRCAIVFVDTSRPGRRRWCSMQRCGNRAKIHAYRDRHDKSR